jgi:hypothetical protein
MACCPDKLFPQLQILLDYLLVALAECDRMVCRSSVNVESEVVWDNCCTCDLGAGVTGDGQAWVNVASIAALTTMTNGQITKCGNTYEATVTVGVVRCAATLADDGSPPDEDVLTAQAQNILQDRAITTRAIRCGLGSVIEPDDWTMGEWTVLGPNGGCVGGLQTFTLRFADAKCTPFPED